LELVPVADPYRLSSAAVQQPPTHWRGVLGRVGPGLILAGAIVGSGELIATTVLGAEVGFVLLWLILLSCLVKVVVQNELGRYAVATGETTLEALNRIPGPRFFVAWPAWLWLLMVAAVMFPVGGLLGAVGEVLNRLAPAVSVVAWVWILDALTLALLLVGRYSVIEKTSVVLVGLFTLVTVAAAAIVLGDPRYSTPADILSGLSFHLPPGGLVTAAAVFGATGVGAGELVMYPYWCIEKGYARWAGPPESSAARLARVRGWIRVLGFDVLGALVLYAFSTVAFYLLGAGVLARQANIPQGGDMVAALSAIFTQTLGPASLPFFLAGAVAVFYSSIFSATAGHARILADFAVVAGWCARDDYPRRLAFMRAAVAATLLIPTLCFLWLQEPVLMVMIGGVAQALMLPVIGFATVYLGRRLPPEIQPSIRLRVLLWVCSAVMFAAAGLYLARAYS